MVVGLLCSDYYCQGRIHSSHPYDKRNTFFSTTGELLQVQYAHKAGSRGSTVFAGCNQEDIVLCIPTSIENQLLLDRRCLDKVMMIDDHIAVAYAGLAGDGRALVKAAREHCIDYEAKFAGKLSIEGLAKYIGEMQHKATLSGGDDPYFVYNHLSKHH